MEGRGSFASRIGIVLATAGSAVGLGNIWRFPYMTGQNGGAAFILLYFCCVFLLGIPGMISEFIVGRHGETNAARAYDILSRGKPWKLVGYLGILTATIILGFYAVVAGWCLEYLFASIMGKIQGDADYVQQYFQTFSSNPIKPCLWAVAFILITHIVVVRGIRNGIERASKLLMPALLILLVIIVIASCLLPGADKGIEFLLKPDFSKLSGSVFLEALGQAFFSLSLGTACLCTYASYFNKDTYLAGSAVGEEEEILIENTETRDQPKNKERAMTLLKSQLYDRAMKKRLEAQAKIEAGKKKIEWGSQIRSYVFDDRRVKDHRTNYQTTDVDGVMDGKLDGFIKAYLMEFPVNEEFLEPVLRTCQAGE